MESGLKVLVLPLCLPVRLWMKARRQAGGGPNSLQKGTKWAILLNRSTMVRMTVFPLEQGNPVMKSTEMWDHGRRGTGRG